MHAAPMVRKKDADAPPKARGRPSKARLAQQQADAEAAASALVGGDSIAAAPSSAAPAHSEMNAAHYAKIRSMLHELSTECDAFSDLANSSPQGRDGRSPCTDDAFAEAMVASGSKYRALCNLLWLSFDETEGPSRGVPILARSIDGLRKHYFQKPAVMPLPVTVAVKTGQTLASMKGSLIRVSPPEMVHAMIIAMHADFTNGGDETTMGAWRAAVLSTDFEFRFIESEDAQHFSCLQDRQDAHANYKGLRLSTIQSIFDVAAFKERKERSSGKLSAADIAAAYMKHVTWAGNPEEAPCTTAYVDSALTVHKRMLSMPAIRTVLLRAEEHDMPNFLDSIVKLQAIVSKASTDTDILWTVTLLLDFYYSNAIYLEQIGTRALQGKTHNSGGKGLVDLLVYKRECLKYLTTEWLDSLAFPSDIKATIRETCNTIEHFRAKCGYAYNVTYKKVSSSWRAGWQPSVDHVLELIEARCGESASMYVVGTQSCSHTAALHKQQDVMLAITGSRCRSQ